MSSENATKITAEDFMRLLRDNLRDNNFKDEIIRICSGLIESENEVVRLASLCQDRNEQIRKQILLCERLVEGVESSKKGLEWRQENDPENWDNSDGDQLNFLNEVLNDFNKPLRTKDAGTAE